MICIGRRSDCRLTSRPDMAGERRALLPVDAGRSRQIPLVSAGNRQKRVAFRRDSLPLPCNVRWILCARRPLGYLRALRSKNTEGYFQSYEHIKESRMGYMKADTCHFFLNSNFSKI